MSNKSVTMSRELAESALTIVARNCTSNWSARVKDGIESALAQEAGKCEQQEQTHKCQKCYGLGRVPTRQAGEGETEYRARCKLYTSPPARVSVVLPSPAELRALVTEAARDSDLIAGSNYYTAAELAANYLLGKVKELNQ